MKQEITVIYVLHGPAPRSLGTKALNVFDPLFVVSLFRNAMLSFLRWRLLFPSHFVGLFSPSFDLAVPPSCDLSPCSLRFFKHALELETRTTPAGSPFLSTYQIRLVNTQPC